MALKKYCIDCKKKLEVVYTERYGDSMGWCPHCFPEGKTSWENLRHR